MTDDFGSEFRTTFQDSAARLARQKQAVTQADVRAAGLVRAEDDQHATVLLYVDQVLVSSRTMQDTANPVQVAQNRALVKVVLVDGSWLVDSIQPF